ncbi:MAG: hypothetical protein EXR71_19525 [Myxococcales bacterium]|nr:hypothetical protein [Myxococcales bacterium]
MRYADRVVLLLLLVGCAPASWRMPGPLRGLGLGADESVATYLARRAPEPPAEAPGGKAAPNAIARKIVAAAESFVGDGQLVVRGENYRFDCSGLVEAALAEAGVPASGSSAMLYEQARNAGLLHHRRRPSAGDVAFFDNTYDRNGNGRLDDELTHTAIVVGVDSDGTIALVHVGSGGVVRFSMNLVAPHQEADDNGKLNDFLRARTRRDPIGTAYLAGELWVAFGRFWAQSAPPAVSDAV